MRRHQLPMPSHWRDRLLWRRGKRNHPGERENQVGVSRFNSLEEPNTTTIPNENAASPTRRRAGERSIAILLSLGINA